MSPGAWRRILSVAAAAQLAVSMVSAPKEALAFSWPEREAPGAKAAVVAAFHAAENSHDISRAIALLADEVVVRGRGGVVAGKARVSAWLAGQLHHGLQIRRGHYHAADGGLIIWRGDVTMAPLGAANVWIHGDGAAIVTNGRIAELWPILENALPETHTETVAALEARLPARAEAPAMPAAARAAADTAATSGSRTGPLPLWAHGLLAAMSVAGAYAIEAVVKRAARAVRRPS